jgi:RNA-dependent RNA polymerase
LKNDNLGIIANSHLAFADQFGCESPECLELADLHSTAVDFAKTGKPAVLNMYPKKYPDFMENKFKTSYQSYKVLGKIYRMAKAESVTSEKLYESWITGRENPYQFNGFERSLSIKGSELYFEEAKSLYWEYMQSLWDIACKFQVFDEAELITGNVREFFSKVSKRAGSKGLLSQMNIEVSELLSYYRHLFAVDDLTEEAAMQKASAWYQVAYSYKDKFDYPPYLSFGWIAFVPMSNLYGTSLG